MITFPASPIAVYVVVMQKEWAYLNHGAFGVALKEGLEAKVVGEPKKICSIVVGWFGSFSPLAYFLHLAHEPCSSS